VLVVMTMTTTTTTSGFIIDCVHEESTELSAVFQPVIERLVAQTTALLLIIHVSDALPDIVV
jgi:hypothetical protein